MQLVIDPDVLGPAQLPWELVHDGQRHLLENEAIRLNRHITYFGDRSSLEPVDRLRVLYASSRPSDTGSLPNWEVEQVRGGLGPLIEGGFVEVAFLPHVTRVGLAEALQRQVFDVLHFDGHGWFDPEASGQLLFEDGDGLTDRVPAEWLAATLGGSGIRLVVLAACQGSMVGGHSVFNSVAPALIRAGVPAVIGNQFSTWTHAVDAFNTHFYRSLARGESISAAVADARKGMKDTEGQWFLPTLYLRVADGEGYLFKGEPEEHRRWREQQAQQSAARYWAMPDDERTQYPEGPPTVNGVPVVLHQAYFLLLAAQTQLAYLNYLSSIDPSVWKAASPERQEQVRRYRETAPRRGDEAGDLETARPERNSDRGQDGDSCPEERRRLQEILERRRKEASTALDELDTEARQHNAAIVQIPEGCAGYLADPLEQHVREGGLELPGRWVSSIDPRLIVHAHYRWQAQQAKEAGIFDGFWRATFQENEARDLATCAERVPVIQLGLGFYPSWAGELMFRKDLIHDPVAVAKEQGWVICRPDGSYDEAVLDRANALLQERSGELSRAIHWGHLAQDRIRAAGEQLRAADEAREQVETLSCDEVRRRLEEIEGEDR